MKRWMLTAALGLLLAATGCVQVGTDEVGVKTVYLSITGDTGVQHEAYGTGYHIYVPPFTGFSVLKKSEQKLEMTRHPEQGSRAGNDELKLKTVDGNDIWVDITLSWHVVPEQAWVVVDQVGEQVDHIEDQVVRPVARSILRYALGRLTAEQFYEAANRESMVREAEALLNENLAPLGLAVTDVMVNDYRFADRYQKAIEDRKLYDQKAREYESLAKAAEQDAKRKVFDARAEANRLIEAARGELAQARLKGDALLYAAEQEAKAILANKQARAAALEQLNRALAGPGGRNLVAKRLAEALQGKDVTIVPMTDGGTVSLVDINRFLEALTATKAVEKMKPAAPTPKPAPPSKPETKPAG